MSNYQFVCDHCGKNFSLEQPEAGECPFCFWSSSVRRADEPKVAGSGIAGTTTKRLSPGSIPDKGLNRFGAIIKVAFIVLLVAGTVYLVYQFYGKWTGSGNNKTQTITIRGAEKEMNDARSQSPENAIKSLPQADQQILLAEIDLSDQPVPGEAEKQVLSHSVKFKTGWSDQLPSAAWTLEQFQQMIAEQERFYKVTLPRSYKKKLRELFESKYLAGTDAFSKGDALAARNLFVESLAFPLYSTDIQKHRGVALTMLRPFINDTLSKIGALNQNILDREARAKEQTAVAGYQELVAAIQNGNYDEALHLTNQLQASVIQMQSVAKTEPVLPSYPAAVAMIDQDIQRALADLSVRNPSSASDLLYIREDLAQKKDVLMDLSREEYRKTVVTYKKAVSLTRDGNYEEAFETFNLIRGPESVRSDAQAKLEVLRKILYPAEKVSAAPVTAS